MDWLEGIWDNLWALPSGAWAAIAAWATVLIAGGTVVVTGRYAKKQVEQAREQIGQAEQARIEQAADAQKLRQEQAQPNVVAFMEPDENHWGFCDLVVKNFGLTPAYDIMLAFTPELDVTPFERLDTGERVTHLMYPREIPMLVPNQEWRTNWDDLASRNEADTQLESKFSALVTYRDSHGRALNTEAVLDWTPLQAKVTVETKNLHSLAKDLEAKLGAQNAQLASIARSLTEFGDEHKGVWVYPTDADAERARRAEVSRQRAERVRLAQERREQRLSQRAERRDGGGE
ncbi:hypothetical protein BH683_017665 [Williamsia sp. 1138]|uniref:hypothetical protein n=1 Tax=Williamsia sp. 1138 TaxID=1903117 RepID=UPI000A117B55|nr:hypothetical protein [Williamsia sp. 1138]OZG27699.1 hypothetical protein BH683_017665 [Williamsia sp. 1138]